MAQSLSKVYVHAIFSTKHRVPIIADDWRDELFAVIGGAVNNVGCQSRLVGGVADHVHLLFVLNRTVSIADAIGTVKKASSSWVNERRKTAATFAWQAGYATFSAAQSNVDAVREYIRNQPEHHKTQSFQDELREWLTRYEEAFDERYIWD